MSRGNRSGRRDMLYENSFDHGICSTSKDRRAPDEIRDIAEVHRLPEVVACFGIFGGHGGSTASELCARNFVPTLLEDLKLLETDPERALRKTCNALEAFVLAKSTLDRNYYGSTVLFVMIKGLTVYVVNIGNSRAVLSTQDGAQSLTREHDGSNAEEVSRVRNAGGFFQAGKVNNLIRVTRAIGDLELKGHKHIAFPNRNMPEDIIISTPDLSVHQLTSRDNFLILATVKVWDHLSNFSAVSIVTEAMRRKESSRVCAKKLADAAIAGGAQGKVTVIVILFTDVHVRGGKTAHSPSRRRHPRSTKFIRHSENAVLELQAKAKPTSSAPDFVRLAQANKEHTEVGTVAHNESSGSASHRAHHRQDSTVAQLQLRLSGLMEEDIESIEFSSVPFPAWGVPPYSEAVAPIENRRADAPHRSREPRYCSRSGTRRARSHLGATSSHSTEGFGGLYGPTPRSGSGLQYNVLPPSVPDFVQDAADQHSTGRGKWVARRAQTTLAPRVSQITHSTGGSSTTSFVGALPGDMDTVDYNPTGPAKIKYRDNDEGFMSRKLGFLRRLGRRG